ncbi:hypothetical protein U9M48_040540, partial [Paspalum notatum var. saurae]
PTFRPSLLKIHLGKFLSKFLLRKASMNKWGVANLGHNGNHGSWVKLYNLSKVFKTDISAVLTVKDGLDPRRLEFKFKAVYVVKLILAHTWLALGFISKTGCDNIMPHLIVHMVDQIRAVGPIYLHEMWAYERFMSTLNRYVLNRAYPEGSMIEAYYTEEVVECCKDYLFDKKGIGLPASRHTGRLSGKGTRGRKTFIDNAYEEVAKIHFSVLHEIEMMTPFVEQHVGIIRAENPERSDSWIMKEHKHRFTSWLMDLNLPEGSTAEEVTLKRLASGLSSRVTTWQAYDINGKIFCTAAKDKKSMCKDSGVRIDAIDDGTGSRVTYSGFIEDIWELDYGSNIQILVFRCQWVRHPQGVQVDNYGLTIVDLAKVGYKNDPWVLAKRVG